MSALLDYCGQAVVDYFSKPDIYITHNATKTLSDITGGNLSDYIHLTLELQKDFYCLFSQAE